MKSFYFRMLLILGLCSALSAATASYVAAQSSPAGAHMMLTRGGYAQQRAAAAQSPQSPAAGNLLYHGGPVMQTASNHIIFWDPNHNIPAGYMSLVNRWFQDIGGSTFYGNLHQYSQTGPLYIQNVSTYGGTWHDTTNAYTHAGTFADPLLDADIQAEVSRAILANGWPKGLTNLYFVYTEKGIESCLDATDCTPGTNYPAFCAYHGHFTSGTDVIYANMPYADTWSTDCRNFFVTPNANLAADSVLSITSHEQFEAVSDPLLNAWYDGAGNENGDKCAYYEGATGSDGRNHTFNGHPYITQLEWSNAVSNCDNVYINPVKKLFLPLVLDRSPAVASLGIHGHVTFNGANAVGVALDLLYFNGSFTSVYASTSSAADGTYQFTGVPSLPYGPGQDYWVRFSGGADTTKLFRWNTRLLNFYLMGSDVNIGNFDVADIPLLLPVPNASVTLPQTFTWTARSATPSDSYQFELFRPGFSSPRFITLPFLGYTGSYVLGHGHLGFGTATTYGWDVYANSPDDGVGTSHYYNPVTFSSVSAASGPAAAGTSASRDWDVRLSDQPLPAPAR